MRVKLRNCVVWSLFPLFGITFALLLAIRTNSASYILQTTNVIIAIDM